MFYIRVHVSLYELLGYNSAVTALVLCISKNKCDVAACRDVGALLNQLLSSDKLAYMLPVVFGVF